MRRAILSSILLVTVVMLSGCTINHDFTFTIVKTFTVSGSVMSYNLSQPIDPTTNSDFNKYKNDISAVEILSSTFNITRNTGSASQVVSSTLIVGDGNDANQATLATAPNVNIMASMNMENPLTMDNTVANQLGNWLKNSPNKANLHLSAATNTTPTDFDVQFTFHVKATYSAGLLSFL